MPTLPPQEVDRCRSHLGYDVPRGISVGAMARFNTVVTEIYSSHSIYGTDGIIYWLDRCDNYLAVSDATNSQAYTQRQLIVGDVNRSTTSLNQKDLDFWFNEYLKQTDQLAFKLNVPNFRRPANVRYLYDRWGDAYVKTVLTSPDTALSDRLYLVDNYW